MKVALSLLALVALSSAIPQPRKLFHEHFEDFMSVIISEVSDDLDAIAQQYIEFEEFRATIDYLSTQNFRDIVAELESLPEFVAVVDFLERDNIDINYFIDLIHSIFDGIEYLKAKKGLERQQISGTGYNSFVRDAIAVFPKDKLSSLYDEKMEEDDVFRVSMENLYSDEWSEVFGALWDSETFQKEVQTLADNGIDITVVLDEILAIFGQLK